MGSGQGRSAIIVRGSVFKSFNLYVQECDNKQATIVQNILTTPIGISKFDQLIAELVKRIS